MLFFHGYKIHEVTKWGKTRGVTPGLAEWMAWGWGGEWMQAWPFQRWGEGGRDIADLSSIPINCILLAPEFYQRRQM